MTMDSTPFHGSVDHVSSDSFGTKRGEQPAPLKTDGGGKFEVEAKTILEYTIPRALNRYRRLICILRSLVVRGGSKTEL